MGHQLTVTREVSSGDQMLVTKNTYNLAGLLTSTTDALNRTTTFAAAMNANGLYEKDSTLPDGSTESQIYNADGTLQSVSGTAVHPLNYQYGVDANGLFTETIRVGSGGAQTEWVKTYVDFAGRPSMTVYADDASASNSYNGLGQMISQTDPDGIVILFAYNGRGEQITKAVDMDRNGVIDVGGTDRITQTATSVLSSGVKTMQRTVTTVSVGNGTAAMVTASILDQTPNGRESWQNELRRDDAFGDHPSTGNPSKHPDRDETRPLVAGDAIFLGSPNINDPLR